MAKIINIDSINPTPKDFERAQGLDFRKQFGRVTFYGNGAPFQSEASKMAKLIKDPEKLIRRAKAVAATWGTNATNGYSQGTPQEQNVWQPFEQALHNMGFTYGEVNKISQYREA
jgi:predicted Rossmann fold nucleotide-binding protein DprA/Smf involved in DNA uptake